MEPAYKRKMRLDEKESRGESLTDYELEERERLKAQMRSENEEADRENDQLPRQARSTDELRAKYKQISQSNRDDVPYSKKGAAEIQKGATASGFQPEQWKKNLSRALGGK